MKRVLCFAFAVFLLFVGIVPAYAASGTSITASKDPSYPYTGRTYIGTKGENRVGELPPLPDGWEWSDPNLALTTSFVQTDVIQRNSRGNEINRITVHVKVLRNGAETSDIGGNVTEGGVGVARATVELYLGTVKVADTVTDTRGNYSFGNVENGIYNIVVTKGDKVKTALVTVDSTGSFSVDVALPVSAVNSVVEYKGSEVSGAKSDINQTVVGGLDAIAEAQTVSGGDKVAIKLTIEPKADTNTPAQQAIKTKAGTDKKVEFLDLSLWKQVNDDAAQRIGNANTQLLTIVIPFDFTGVDVSSVMILRHHGSSEKLTKNPAAGQEGYVVNAQAGAITLYAMKFSDYALAYKEKTSDDPGGGGSSGGGGRTPVYEDTMPFVDVAKNAYYYDAVKWAAKNGITSGVDAVHFAPLNITTRAQMVTFLWRAAGSPEPTGDASKFVDVKVGSFYEKAVAWAIEQGITKGTSATTFSPDVNVSRAQAVTFLARMSGVKDDATGYTHKFADVKTADYFNNAVAWAATNKITDGTSATTFSPNDDCLRCQIVTFLYRYFVK